MIFRLEFRQLFGILGSGDAQRRTGYNRLQDRLGVVGRDHTPGQCNIGQIGTEGVEIGVGRVRTTRKRELNGRARRRAAVR
jgi:hypothetical protein